MILVNGCSFSTPTGLDPELENFNWPEILSDKMNIPIKNLSHEGKSNRLIYKELYTYLIWAKQNKVEFPKYVIMQTSDNFRDHIFSGQKSGRMLPNDFESQFDIPGKQYVKLFSWKGHLMQKDKKHSGSVLKRIVPYTSRIRNSHGVIKKEETQIEHIPVGDTTLVEPKLRSLIEHCSLQKLCKELDIPLLILNFYGFKGVQEDPLYKELDMNMFISNQAQKGLYNHLEVFGFDKTDDYHFNVDGHLYITDIVYDYFINNKQIEMLSSLEPIDTSFDYT
jgi:hypothetical protein